MRKNPIVWLTISTGYESVPSSNYWTANVPLPITVKRITVATV